MRNYRFGIAKVLAMLLISAQTGCSHLPVTSMVKLARVEFEKTDPAQLRAAVKLPGALRPHAKGVALHILIKMRSGEEEAHDFVLRQISDPSELSELRAEADGETEVYAFRLDAAEAMRLGVMRENLMKKKQTASGSRGGSLTISIKPEVCRTGEVTGPLLVTTYLRTNETGGYVALARDVDLRSIVRGRDFAVAIPMCG